MGNYLVGNGIQIGLDRYSTLNNDDTECGVLARRNSHGTTSSRAGFTMGQMGQLPRAPTKIGVPTKIGAPTKRMENVMFIL